MLRRSFLKGLGATLFVAPSIVRAENLMPIKEYMPEVPIWCPANWLPCDGREIKKKFYPELHAVLGKCRLPQFASSRQLYGTYSSYEIMNLNKPPLGATRIISYKNLKYANGRIVPAGVISDFWAPLEE